MWSRLPLLAMLAGAGLLCGCASTYPMPLAPLTPSQLNLAREEVQTQASEGQPFRHHVTDEEATTVLRSAVEKIGPAATRLCHEMAVGQCRWTINGSPGRSLAIALGPDGLIVINRGIMEYANNEEEVAVVVAYGFAHHSANHFASRRNGCRAALEGAPAKAILRGGGKTAETVTRQVEASLKRLGLDRVGVFHFRTVGREAYAHHRDVPAPAPLSGKGASLRETFVF